MFSIIAIALITALTPVPKMERAIVINSINGVVTVEINGNIYEFDGETYSENINVLKVGDMIVGA